MIQNAHLIKKHKTAVFEPILACAIAMPYEYYNPKVDDSKKLPHKTIYRLAQILKTKMIWTIGIVSVEELLVILFRKKLILMWCLLIGSSHFLKQVYNQTATVFCRCLNRQHRPSSV